MSPEQGLFSFEGKDAATRFAAELISEHFIHDISEIIRTQEMSYRRFAEKELLYRLNSEDAPPLIILERFRDLMQKYSHYSKGTELIFAVAADTAEYYIRLLC